eukprot:gene12706-26763_t
MREIRNRSLIVVGAADSFGRISDDHHSTCLRFFTADTFGDGWHSAIFEIADKHGVHLTSTISQDSKSVYKSYCFDSSISKDGDTVIAGVNGLTEKQFWEIYWTATDDNGSTYIGTFKTFMTFEYHANNGSYWTTLKNSHNILPIKKSCSNCETFEIKKTPTKKSYTSTEQSKQKSGSKSAYKAHSRQLLESYHLYGKSDSWSSLDGYGTTFDISSADGITRFFSGSLCNGSIDQSSVCDISKLSEGNYIWRVSGAFSDDRDDVSWEFCGVKGGAMTEVLFHMDAEGDC